MTRVKTMAKRRKLKWTIRRGEDYDLQHLLCSSKRNFLIKFHPNAKQNTLQVDIDQIRGKHVLLYFVWLSKDHPKEFDFYTCVYHDDLVEAYNDLAPQGQFEVVFVPLGDDGLDDIFNLVFSNIPWLAIPYQDKEARLKVQERFAIPNYDIHLPRTLMFAPTGIVMDEGLDSFGIFGSEGFPFTDAKLDQVEKDDQALLENLYMKRLSLTDFLGDNVITNEGQQVSTSHLEGKTVGLYFYDASFFGIERTRTLKKLWELVRSSRDKDFEIVVDHSLTVDYSSKTEFKDEFGSIPWYNLCRSDKKLNRILKVGMWSLKPHRNAGYLIVLQPNEQPGTLNYFALDIFNVFGIDAYPFTLDEATRLWDSSLKERLTLDKLLPPDAPLCRGSSTCTKRSRGVRCSNKCVRKENIVDVSDVLGKRVLLLFDTDSSYQTGKLSSKLEKMYYELHGTDGHFEVIYISLDLVRPHSSLRKCIDKMPWLVYSVVPDFAHSLAVLLFSVDDPVHHLPAIAAFGPSGNLVGKEWDLALKEELGNKFPFVNVFDKAEARKELNRINKWDLELLFKCVCDLT